MANGSVREYTLNEVEDILRTGNVNGIVSEGADAAEALKKTLSSEEAEELAFNAIKGLDKADAVVFGKFVPELDDSKQYILDVNGNRIPSEKSYNVIAEEMGAQYFEIDNWDELVDIYGEEQIWKINEKFLDIQIASGRDIYLSANPKDFREGQSYYAKEIQYLEEHGYRFIKEGDMWHAVQ